MRVFLNGLAVMLLFAAGGSAEPGTETVCVAARAQDSFRGQVQNADREQPENIHPSQRTRRMGHPETQILALAQLKGGTPVLLEQVIPLTQDNRGRQ